MNKKIKNNDFIFKRKINIYIANFKIWLKSILILLILIIIIISYNYVSNIVKNFFIEISSELGFKLNNIVIEGQNNLNIKQVLAKFNADNNTPIFLIDLEEIKEILLESKWVKQVFVMRKLPNTIVIKIIETKPIGIWQIMHKFFVIDNKGNIIDDNVDKFSYLPHFVGNQANIYAAQLLEIIANRANILDNIQSVVRVGNRRWNFILNNNAIIKIPEQNIKAALDFLDQQYFANLNVMQNVKVLDMRDQEKYYIEQR